MIWVVWNRKFLIVGYTGVENYHEYQTVNTRAQEATSVHSSMHRADVLPQGKLDIPDKRALKMASDEMKSCKDTDVPVTQVLYTHTDTSV